MSYDINWKCRVEDTDLWVDCYNPEANITWNVGEMIRKSTGLEWKNEADNGLVKDVIPKIIEGLKELESKPKEYEKYNSPNGYGTIEGVKKFFLKLISEWEKFSNGWDYERELSEYAHFWIE